MESVAFLFHFLLHVANPVEDDLRRRLALIGVSTMTTRLIEAGFITRETDPLEARSNRRVRPFRPRASGRYRRFFASANVVAGPEIVDGTLSGRADAPCFSITVAADLQSYTPGPW
ncbi:helix-turn-helix domain-containing protein [Pseudorhodobacter aquimaris]|uniref:hypothetical protein n=1 Tax=Pseudorhodobacter aquimaris TaxID=687412 RepID=UPI00067ABA52|nr:hypothetical protein [Pseudorhodobacter aquimaris]